VGEHKAEDVDQIRHELIFLVVLKVLHSILSPQKVQNEIFEQTKLWFYLFLRGLNGVGYMIIRRDKIIKFWYLVNYNSCCRYHKRRLRLTVQVHANHKLHKAGSDVVSEALVVHDLEDSFE
jgi:hypothetical protein